MLAWNSRWGVPTSISEPLKVNGQLKKSSFRLLKNTSCPFPLHLGYEAPPQPAEHLPQPALPTATAFSRPCQECRSGTFRPATILDNGTNAACRLNSSPFRCHRLLYCEFRPGLRLARRSLRMPVSCC